MKRIGIIADAHANLPAAEAALKVLNDCSTVIHLGDLLSIGPRPLETLTLMLTNKTVCLMGRSDSDCVGHEDSQHEEHIGWVRRQLSDDHRKAVQRWPYQLNLKIANYKIKLLHYALTGGSQFKPASPDDDHHDRDRLHNDYREVDSDIVVFGDTHQPCDLRYNGKHYLNPGSLGCSPEPQALVLEEHGSKIYISRRPVEYDSSNLVADMIACQVPSHHTLIERFLAFAHMEKA